LQIPDVQKRLESQGVVTIVSAPHEFDALIRADTDRFERMLTQAGVAGN
jgi:tripartite-type tricarboxylate transporter receptor subunit TctC